MTISSNLSEIGPSKSNRSYELSFTCPSTPLSHIKDNIFFLWCISVHPKVEINNPNGLHTDLIGSRINSFTFTEQSACHTRTGRKEGGTERGRKVGRREDSPSPHDYFNSCFERSSFWLKSMTGEIW